MLFRSSHYGFRPAERWAGLFAVGALLGLAVACGDSGDGDSEGGGSGDEGPRGTDSSGLADGGGGPGTGGSGSGSTVNLWSQPSTNCPARCAKQAGACGAAAEADSVCSDICDFEISEGELACLEEQDCESLEVYFFGSSDICSPPPTGGGNPGDGDPGDGDPGDGDPGDGDPGDGEPGDGDKCPVDKRRLRESFPYVSKNPATLVTTYGFCSKGGVEGPNGADVLYELEIRSKRGISEQGGVLFSMGIELTQRKLGSTDINALSSRTGLPSAMLSKGQQVIRTTGATPRRISGPSLPSGVSIEAFLATKDRGEGWLRFTSTSKAALESLLDDLDRDEMLLELEIGRFSGSGTYRYTVEVRESLGALTGKVESITP